MSRLTKSYRWYHQAWPRIIAPLGIAIGAAGKTSSHDNQRAWMPQPELQTGASPLALLLLPAALLGLAVFGLVDAFFWLLVKVTGGFGGA
jgi:hypothetical protein